MQMNTQRIGIDVGFGDVKLARLDDAGRVRTTVFPAILGRAENRTKISVGLGGRRRHIQAIEYDGQTYFIGEGAIVESRLTAARQDQDRIGSVEERVLMLAALARARVTDTLLVTGLPVLWWNSRRDLVKSWRGTHNLKVNGKSQTITVREVRPVWQPLGSFYGHFLRNDGAARADEATLRAGFGIVDIGLNTTDLTGLNNLQPVGRWTTGIRVGVRDALEVISADIEARYQVRRPLPELALALRQGGITIYREHYPMDGIATSALESLAQEIVSQATRQWGQADRFHTVLVTGGGAALLGERVRAAFPHNAEVLNTPGTANAVGFAKFAQRRIFKADRSG